LPGCKKDSPAKVEQPVAVVAPQPPKVEPEAAKLAPATMNDVQAAVKRVFGDDVGVSGAFTPAFVTGDLNGDGSEDLAVIVHPVAAKLGDVNSEFANWIMQDADQYFLPPQGKTVVIPPTFPRPKIADEDVLAIIHGIGAHGWRNPDARQTYLLKHGAATYSGTVVSSTEKSIRALRLAVKTDALRGERNHKRGFLFWTGSAYGWRDAN
jgi:stage V sporulation protein SpoVS